jgi:hypothetical protein
MAVLHVQWRRVVLVFAAVLVGIVWWAALSPAGGATLARRALRGQAAGPNQLRADRWRPWKLGFATDGEALVCDNGRNEGVERGASQTVVLNQARPIPIVATASSRAEGVTGAPNSDYALYVDLVYTDGTSLWGQTAPFAVGSHDWQQRKVLVVPDKPIRSVTVNLLLRRHAGRVAFRQATLSQLAVPNGAARFDGVAVELPVAAHEGLLVRDVAAESDFVRPVDAAAIGLSISHRISEREGDRFVDVTVRDKTGKDRAVTLVYTLPVGDGPCMWFADPRRKELAEPGREYAVTGRFRAGATGTIARYPLAAVEAAGRGRAIGIDLAYPAVFRVGFNAATRELFLAWDIGLAPEKPAAQLRLCLFDFDPDWGFRAALDRYQRLFPEYFRCRTPEQGLWMPFAAISQVEGWRDFGFKFKEGTGETAWDDAHGMITFRYTEPMTWWMRMPAAIPRDLTAAFAEAKRLAAEGRPAERQRARTLLTSGYHDKQGQPVALFRNEPWCHGAVWSINSMPGIVGDVTDFATKWNPQIRATLYGPDRRADLDGEYIDSSEGYVTAQLDFRRDHFAATQTPLTFSWEDRRPAIFRGLIACEYIRALAKDVHALDKLMMANATPIRLCWLAPWLDVMGTETDWHRNGKWQPMSDAELLYRRSLCGPKPYCFLMNTDFDNFSHDLVEKYMQRAVAYGMFPGFFSANAATGHYFKRPELYNRDRSLFLKYVPICRQLAQAGWRPITAAWSSQPRVYVERFGARYLTVFNDSSDPIEVDITRTGPVPQAGRELLSGRAVTWRPVPKTPAGAVGATCHLRLAGEDLAVLDTAAAGEP